MSMGALEWPELQTGDRARPPCSNGLADPDRRAVERHRLARADLARLAQFDPAVDLHVAHRDALSRNRRCRRDPSA